MQNSAEKHMNWKKALFLLCLIWPPASAASLVQHGRNLAQEGDESNPKEISPSPSSDQGAVEANPPETPVVPKATCDRSFNQCHYYVQNITACLVAENGVSDGMFLFVLNDGENSLQLNVTVLPVNTTLDIGEVLAHRDKKINVSLDASRSSAIVLNAANWTCRIGKNVRFPLSFPFYMESIKPIYGIYFGFGTVLLIGVIWACCKWGTDARHLDGGVPYQELEMGQQETAASTNVETVDGWDHGWDDDDDWDLEMTVKPPGESHEGNGQVNGVSSKSADGNGNGNGWGSEWNE